VLREDLDLVAGEKTTDRLAIGHVVEVDASAHVEELDTDRAAVLAEIDIA